MEQFKGLIPNLNTEISTSRAKSFCAVDLIDSPGLVDGNMQVGCSAVALCCCGMRTLCLCLYRIDSLCCVRPKLELFVLYYIILCLY